MIYEDAFILAVTFFVLFLVGSVIIIICGDKMGKTSEKYPSYKPIKR